MLSAEVESCGEQQCTVVVNNSSWLFCWVQGGAANVHIVM